MRSSGTAILLAAVSGIFNIATGFCGTAAVKPNFVIFYADDLGWGETGVQGNTDIPTPPLTPLQGTEFGLNRVMSPQHTAAHRELVC